MINRVNNADATKLTIKENIFIISKKSAAPFKSHRQGKKYEELRNTAHSWHCTETANKTLFSISRLRQAIGGSLKKNAADSVPRINHLFFPPKKIRLRHDYAAHRGASEKWRYLLENNAMHAHAPVPARQIIARLSMIANSFYHLIHQQQPPDCLAARHGRHRAGTPLPPRRGQVQA